MLVKIGLQVVVVPLTNPIFVFGGRDFRGSSYLIGLLFAVTLVSWKYCAWTELSYEYIKRALHLLVLLE